MKTFGERLRAARLRAGLTQEQVALELGLSKAAVSRWEVGGTQPGVEALAMLRGLFGVSLDELICGDAKDAAAHSALSAKELQLIQRYRKLPSKKRELVLALLDL